DGKYLARVRLAGFVVSRVIETLGQEEWVGTRQDGDGKRDSERIATAGRSDGDEGVIGTGGRGIGIGDEDRAGKGRRASERTARKVLETQADPFIGSDAEGWAEGVVVAENVDPGCIAGSTGVAGVREKETGWSRGEAGAC